jgi:hypothetical protein
MNVVLSAKVDADEDGRIDALPLPTSDSTTVRHADVLVVSQEALPNDFEGPLSVTASTASHDTTASETVALHYAEHPEQERPFSVTRDAYRFENPTMESWREAGSLLTTDPVPFLLGAWGRYLQLDLGRCYGMSGTAGLYFAEPEQKPFSRAPYDPGVEKTDPNVLRPITRYHLAQDRTGLVGRLGDADLGDEFETVESALTDHRPVLLGIQNEAGGRHALLATKMTTLPEQNDVALTVYDSNYPGTTLEATYDAEGERFRYASYDGFDWRNTFVSTGVSAEALTTWQERAKENVRKLLGGARKAFTASITSVAGGAQAAKRSGAAREEARMVNVLVENAEGERAGHLPDGSPVREIPDAEVKRVAASDTSAAADSLSFVYVPAGGGAYDVSMQSSESTGNVRFERYVPASDSTLDATVADSVSFSESTVATYEESGEEDVLRVDHDGDGTTDETVEMEGDTKVDVAPGDGETALPARAALKKSYPNPVRRTATIRYELPEARAVALTVFDLLGREVATLVDRKRPAGRHDVRLDASALPAGVYVYRLTAGAYTATRRMVVVQ